MAKETEDLLAGQEIKSGQDLGNGYTLVTLEDGTSFLVVGGSFTLSSGAAAPAGKKKAADDDDDDDKPAKGKKADDDDDDDDAPKGKAKDDDDDDEIAVGDDVTFEDPDDSDEELSGEVTKIKGETATVKVGKKEYKVDIDDLDKD